MKQNKLLKQALALGVLSLLFSACSTKQLEVKPTYKLTSKPSKENIFSLKQGTHISLNKLVKETEKYPIIFVGDSHDTEK